MKVYIGVSEYNVSLAPESEIREQLKTDDDFDVLGLCNNYSKEILINKDTYPIAKKETLFHELVHAFLDEIGYSTYNNDEVFIDALSKQIMGFFNRNNIDKIYKSLKIE